MKKVLLGIVLLTGLSIAAPSAVTAEDPLKIGVVNLRRIFSEYEDVAKSSQALKVEVEKQQKLIDEKKQEITKLTEELEKQEIVLSKEEKGKREEVIDAKVKQLQDFVVDVNQSLKETEGKLKGDIVDRILNVVKELALQDNYDLVFEKYDKILLFSQPKFDITDQVLERLKKMPPSSPSPAVSQGKDTENKKKADKEK